MNSQFRWSPDAVRRLDDEVQWAFTSNPAGPAEVAGVLLGRPGPTIEITDCQPVFLMHPRDRARALMGPGKRALDRTIAAFKSVTQGGLSVVGFYRSHIGAGFELSEEDFELIRTALRDTSQITLLINVTGNASRNVKLFIGEDGQPFSEFDSSDDTSAMPRWLELWQHLSGDAEREPPQPNEVTESEGRDTSEPVPTIVTEESLEEPVSAEPPSRRGLSYGLAGTLILCLLVGFLVFRGSARLKQRAETPGGAAQSIRRESGNDSELALRARRDGDDLQLDWNHTAPLLAAASGGILTIREANAQEKNVTVGGDLLRTGAVVYRPLHGDVFLRLVIFGQGGAKLGESVATCP